MKSVAIRLIGIFALWLSIFVSKGNLRMCVFFSDIIVVMIWILLKYSDRYFWRNLMPDSEYFSSSQYGSDCHYVAVNIHKDNILYKQTVYIKNLLDEKIDYIEGVIKFFFRNTEKNQIVYKKIDIDSGKEVKIDEISYNTDRQYSDKVFWDTVELYINNIVTKDKKRGVWSGTVIQFFSIYNFDQFNYLRVGLIKILPYEITWFKNRIIMKIWLFTQFSHL